MPYLIAVNEPVFWSVGNPVVASGLTEVGGATLTGLTLYSNANPNTYLGALPSDSFPALPGSGWLEQNDIYDWQSTLVMVRQSHNRTIYPPDQTPALFLVYRPDAADVLDWVAGEQVYAGTRRMYADVLYECLQAHVTQADWTPPATPALWRVVEAVPTIGAWVQPTGAHDAYPLGAQVTHNGHLWESLYAANVWEPGSPGTAGLWEDLGVYP